MLLLIPRTRVLGALLACGVMGGAILSHLFVLGISVQDDGGLLFGLAWLVLIASVGIVWLHRSEALAFFETTIDALGFGR